MSQKLLRLSVVQEEGLEILSVKDRDKLVAMITASAAMLVDAEAVVLRVFEKKGKRLLVGSTYGLHKNEMDTKLVELDGLIALKVFQMRIPQVLDDLRLTDSGLPAKFPYRYSVCRPVVYGGTAEGTLSIYNKLSFQSFGCTAFDQDDTELLEKFSYYVGKALINLHEVQTRSALITIDELTGLRNERYLMMRLPEEVRRAERYRRSLALMIFEVKSEAETQPAPGSSAEGEFIKQVAEVLQEKFRNVDIVVRIKGARFAILMPDTGETVTDAVARLSRGLAILPLKVFIGYSTYPADAKSAQAMITKASKLSEMVREP
ncbi:MAG: diguanylate cyclase, partial [Nitrospira sp.]|nr:diguanylate cyclase [Nitrospira sp.]